MTPLSRIRTTLSSVLLPGDPLRSLIGYLNCLVALRAVDYGDRTDLIDELDARWKEAKKCTENT